MTTSGYCRVMATSVVVFIFSLGTSSWPQDFRRSHRDAWGPRYKAAPRGGQVQRREHIGLDSVRHWNEIALNANALDHVPVAPEGPEQLRPPANGPGVCDRPHRDLRCGERNCWRLQELHWPFPRTQRRLHACLYRTGGPRYTGRSVPLADKEFRRAAGGRLEQDPDGRAKKDGIDLGRQAAAAILALRANDGSQHDEELYGDEYMPAAGPGKWRQDPISQIPIALGSRWAELVTPFVLMSANQFPVPPPPALNTSEYAAAFNEVKNYGGCGDDHVGCDGDYGGSVTPTIANPGADPDRHLLGLRWHTGPGHAAAALQPDRGADRRAKGLGCRRAGAPLGASQCGDGRRRPHVLGNKIQRRVLAPDHRYPQGR